MSGLKEASRGIDTVLPERIRFSPAETLLAVRAVGGYAISRLRTLEGDWPSDSLRTVSGSLNDLRSRVDVRRRILDDCSEVMDRLGAGEGNPHGIELTGSQLALTMQALYNFGHSTSREARAAIEGGEGRFDSAQQIQTVTERIGSGVEQAEALFRKLEPTAIKYKLNPRPLWDAGPTY